MENKLPEGWEWKKLGEILKVIYRYPSYYGINYVDEGVPEIRGELLLEDGTLQKDITKYRFISYETSNKFPKTALKKGDIVMSVRGTIGKIGLIPAWLEGANITANLIRLSPDDEIIMGEYLKHLMLSKNFKQQIDNCSPQTTIKTIQVPNLSSILVPIPPLEIQQKIVSILEKAEETKKLRAQADELTQKLLQNVFLEMFGDSVKNPKKWDEKSLEDLCSHIIDCPHSTPKYEECITPYPCIRTTELKNGYIDWSEMKYVSEEGYKERTKRLVPVEGDVVYGREGTYGEAIRIHKNTNICLGQRVMLFRPNHNLCNSEFLWALVRSDGIYQQAIRKTSGSTVGHVNVNEIKKFTCFCPPLSLQDEFSSIVKSIEVLKENQQQSSLEINTFFDALMQKAFTGELIA